MSYTETVQIPSSTTRTEENRFFSRPWRRIAPRERETEPPTPSTIQHYSTQIRNLLVDRTNALGRRLLRIRRESVTPGRPLPPTLHPAPLPAQTTIIAPQPVHIEAPQVPSTSSSQPILRLRSQSPETVAPTETSIPSYYANLETKEKEEYLAKSHERLKQREIQSRDKVPVLPTITTDITCGCHSSNQERSISPNEETLFTFEFPLRRRARPIQELPEPSAPREAFGPIEENYMPDYEPYYQLCREEQLLADQDQGGSRLPLQPLGAPEELYLAERAVRYLYKKVRNVFKKKKESYTVNRLVPALATLVISPLQENGQTNVPNADSQTRTDTTGPESSEIATQTSQPEPSESFSQVTNEESQPEVPKKQRKIVRISVDPPSEEIQPEIGGSTVTERGVEEYVPPAPTAQRRIVSISVDPPNYAPSNVVSAGFNQADLSLLGGNQCTGIVAVAAAFTILQPAETWDASTLNTLLFAGDTYYRDIINANPRTHLTLYPEEANGTVVFGNRRVRVRASSAGWYGVRDGFESETSGILTEAIQSLIGSQHATAYLVTGGSTFGVFIDRLRNFVYLFDSHGRGPDGVIKEEGYACLVRYDLLNAARCISRLVHTNVGAGSGKGVQLLNQLEVNQFSLIPIYLTDVSRSRRNSGATTPATQPALTSRPSTAPGTAARQLFVPEGQREVTKSEGSSSNHATRRVLSTAERPLDGACRIRSKMHTNCSGLTLATTAYGTCELIKKRIRVFGKDIPSDSICETHAAEICGARFQNRLKLKGCVDPFKSHRKKLTQSSRLEVISETDARELAHFTNGDYVEGMLWCNTCRLKKNALIKEMPPDVDLELQAHADAFTPASEDMDIAGSDEERTQESDDEYDAPELMEQDTMDKLNRTVLSLGESPISTRRVKGKRRPVLQTKFVKASDALKTAFREHPEWATPQRKVAKTSSPPTNVDPNAMSQLRMRYEAATTKREKYLILTTTPVMMSAAKLIEAFGCKAHEARQAVQLRKKEGVFSAPTPANRPRLPESTIKLVLDFYRSDEYSRPFPGQDKTRLVPDLESGGKKRESKRLILMTLEELYHAFSRKRGDT